MIKLFTTCPLPLKLAATLIFCFFLQELFPNITPLFAFSNQNLHDGHWWTLITYAFLHGGGLHLLMNLMALTFMFPINQLIGPKRTMLYYLAGCLAGSVVHIGRGNETLVGASAGISTIATLFVLFLPEEKILFMFLPIKAKWGGVAFLIFSFAGMFGHGKVAHDSHLAGVAVGILAWLATPKKSIAKNLEELKPSAPSTEGARPTKLKGFIKLSYAWLLVGFSFEIWHWWNNQDISPALQAISSIYLALSLLLALLPSKVMWPARSLLILTLLKISFPGLELQAFAFLISVVILSWATGLLTLDWLNKGAQDAN